MFEQQVRFTAIATRPSVLRWLVPNLTGRSAVSISSRANGALANTSDTKATGSSYEIAPPGCRSSVRRSTEPTFGSSGSGAHSRAAGRC